MHIAIHTYCGVANTSYVARALADFFSARSLRVTQREIRVDSLERAGSEPFDMLGVGFPIHFRQPPSLVVAWLSRIAGNGRPIFFFATKGLYSGNAVRMIAEQALRQGFSCIGSLELWMPGVDALILLARKGSVTERMLKRIHSRDIPVRIEGFSDRVLLQVPQPLPGEKWYGRLDEMVVKSAEKRFDDEHRALIGSFRVDDAACIACLQCVALCPRGNITYQGRIGFGMECDVCFGCVHRCPVEAIQIGDTTDDKARYPEVDLL